MLCRFAIVGMTWFVVGMGAPVHAQPRLAIQGPIHWFGAVDQGTTVAHTFRLLNQGTAPLRIHEVKTSCGCTVAVTAAEELRPGDFADVEVRLDTTQLAGHATKTVTVHSSDPAVPVAGLTLTGEVVADVVTNPPSLWLGRLRQGESRRFEIVVASGRLPVGFTVTGAEADSQYLLTHVEPASDGSGLTKVVVETMSATPPGRFNGEITIQTTSPQTPLVRVPVFGTVEVDVAGRRVPPQPVARRPEDRRG